jgi:membrane fusion protein (multidrug efflux system)
MSCVVRVHNQDPAPQLVIPNKAVVEEMGEYFVYVAKDSVPPGSGDTTKERSTAGQTRVSYAFQKKVQLGAALGPNVIAKNGINEGERIVADGVQSLHNGSQIVPSEDRNTPRPDKTGR